jgi:glycosyltransferase involved in cell wall biosynthesis
MSKNGKILVNGRFLHARVTGVQRYAGEITRCLGGRVEVIAPPAGPEAAPPGASVGWRGHWWEQRRLARQVGKNDLLWSPANSGPLAVERQIITLHDLAVLDHPEWFTRVYVTWYRYLIPKLARRAKRVFTVSEYSRQRILKVLGLPEENVIVVPGGASLRFQPAAAAEIASLRTRYELENPYVVAVGTIERRKNLPRLLQAWKMASAEFPEVELLIAGGHGRAFRAVDLDVLPRRTRLLGYVADSELPALYSGALALIFPSLYEGFGLPALEAMACGTPVIVSCAGALPEVVGEAGLYFDPHEVRQIAEALQSILSDPALRRELGQKGLQHARQFSWQSAAEQIYTILHQIWEEGQA